MYKRAGKGPSGEIRGIFLVREAIKKAGQERYKWAKKRKRDWATEDQSLDFIGAPRRIRTSDIRIRSPTLYPAEPWALNMLITGIKPSASRYNSTYKLQSQITFRLYAALSELEFHNKILDILSNTLMKSTQFFKKTGGESGIWTRSLLKSW